MMVLVVDDQENMCWILSRILSNAGFSVVTANTAREALSIAREGGISGAVIDFRLPDSNGLDLFQELRKEDPALRGVFITSYGSRELWEKALELGFDACFDKSLDNNSLVTGLSLIWLHKS